MRHICKTSYGSSESVFKNTLHAPDLAFNLISINRFDKAGFRIIFGEGQVCFQDPDGRDMMCGTGDKGMYLLEAFGNINEPTTLVARSQTQPTILEVWHH